MPGSGCRVYFIEAIGTDMVKIGFTGNGVERRLAALQTSCPLPLRLLACVQGTEQYERALHERFAAERVRGEWFHLRGDVRAFIDAHSSELAAVAS